MWLFFRKEPKNLPKCFQKNIFHFIDLQLEMWRILWIFFPKIIWTNLESILCVCVCVCVWGGRVCDNSWRFESVFYFLKFLQPNYLTMSYGFHGFSWFWWNSSDFSLCWFQLPPKPIMLPPLRVGQRKLCCKGGSCTSGFSWGNTTWCCSQTSREPISTYIPISPHT